uniref:endo-polygalacturonase n=1 Tax=Diabrotica virgifera virgifera TaxID=50390 RepID=A0A088BZM4_DIAVI|nr:glycoside hydrolase family 28 [Diabrotica virgifera virgifera]
MTNLTLVIVFSVIVATIAIPFNSTKNIGDGCTISNIWEVENVVKNCKNIVVNNLYVPGGQKLELKLHSGTVLKFQGTTTFQHSNWEGPLVEITGSNLHVSGAGAILDGLGAQYWDGYGDKGAVKPKFLKIRTTGSTFDNIHLLNCPRQCVSILSSKQTTLTNFNIDVSAGDITHLATNTDGFDLSDSDGITIENSVVRNQDDCVAVNSGKNYHFNKLNCNGGHGLSLSVGMSKNDSPRNHVEDVTFSNCIVSNSLNGIHIKTHSDAGKGYINGVEYRNIILKDITNYGINVQQDYQGGHSTGYPTSNIPINGLKLEGVTGSLRSGQPVYIFCGNNACFNFNWSGVSITGGNQQSSCNYHPNGYYC